MKIPYFLISIIDIYNKNAFKNSFFFIQSIFFCVKKLDAIDNLY